MKLDTAKYMEAFLGELEQFESILLQRFDSEVAWEIGCAAKSAAAGLSKPILIDITDSLGRVLFHSPSKQGTIPDNESWIERKKRTVFRFGKSSFYMGRKLEAKEAPSIEKAFYVSSDEYAVHGGAVPIRIQGFDGVVAVLSISGLKQEEDHALALDVLHSFA